MNKALGGFEKSVIFEGFSKDFSCFLEFFSGFSELLWLGFSDLETDFLGILYRDL